MRREARRTICMWRTREKENKGCEGGRMNGEKVEREKERVKRVGHGWCVGGGIQLIVGKLLTSDWNAP